MSSVSANIGNLVILSVYLAVCINTKLFIGLIALSSVMFYALFHFICQFCICFCITCILLHCYFYCLVIFNCFIVRESYYTTLGEIKLKLCISLHVLPFLYSVNKQT